MLYITGILVALSAIIAAIVHLNQTFYSYYDFVALSMVVGGTGAVALMTLPFEFRQEIFKRVGEVFRRAQYDRKHLLQECIQMSSNVLKGVSASPDVSKGLAYSILNDGYELIQLGLTSKKIEVILKERVYQTTERARYVANSIRGLSKYPPAFGLVGTVLGLVHLMRGVSDGMSPQETGIRMAIALVATFYGLLVANFVVNPIGDAIFKNSYDDEKMGEIALQAVMLAADRTNLLEAQELLNSYVDHNERVDLIGVSGFNAETANANQDVNGNGVAA